MQNDQTSTISPNSHAADRASERPFSATATELPPRFLRVKTVAERLGISVGSVWRLAKTREDFPKPVRWSANSTGFLESELNAYIAARVKAMREPLAA